MSEIRKRTVQLSDNNKLQEHWYVMIAKSVHSCAKSFTVKSKDKAWSSSYARQIFFRHNDFFGSTKHGVRELENHWWSIALDEVVGGRRRDARVVTAAAAAATRLALNGLVVFPPSPFSPHTAFGSTCNGHAASVSRATPIIPFQNEVSNLYRKNFHTLWSSWVRLKAEVRPLNLLLDAAPN